MKLKDIFKFIHQVYYIHYFPPEPHRYAYHTTSFWLEAQWYLWMVKKNGYKQAYIEIRYE